MGLFDRVKNMFTEEVEEPENINKQKDEKKEVKAEIEEETVNEQSENIKENTNEKVKSSEQPERPRPIFFDDQDFATLERPKVKEEKTIIEEKYYTKKTETTEKKVFKLSPVISPVYGVLDKNYHKEDITPKRSTPKVTYYDKESITIDEVRKKAYGSLDNGDITYEEEKRNVEEKITSRVQKIYNDDNIMDDLMNPDYNINDDVNAKEEEMPETRENLTKTLEPIALEDFLLSSDEEEATDEEYDYKDPLDDTLTESDLFHLIDSMYDKEDE